MCSHYPIFIVTLEDAEARRKPLIDWLASQGLVAELFPAIDARQGVPEEYEALLDRPLTVRRMMRELSNGEYGCALSHRALYEKIVKEKLPGAIILEDDAIPHPKFASFLRAGDAEKADMIIFDYLRVSVSRWHEESASQGVKLHKVLARSTRTTGYSISQTGAQKMLAATTPISHVADWPIDLYKVGAWATYPKLIGHPLEEDVPSTIGEARAALTKRSRKNPMRCFTAEHWRKKLAKRVG